MSAMERSFVLTLTASTQTSLYHCCHFGFSTVRLTLRPPFILVSVHTKRFMACSGLTHGPPVLLHPGQLAMAVSMPSESARCMTYWKQSFHCGDI